MPIVAACAATCLGAQTALAIAFRRVPGPWSRSPTFSAHQLVVVGAMSYVACVGCVGFASASAAALTTPEMRFHSADATGVHLVDVSIGILCWSIPTKVCVAELQSTAMFVHHALYSAVCYLVWKHRVMTVWVNVYFGVIEGSTVPLALCQLFRAPGWSEVVSTSSRHAVERVFVASYAVLRLGVFPYCLCVARVSVLRDALHVWHADPSVSRELFAAIAFGSVSLLVLQLYWGALIARRVTRTMRAKAD